VKKGSPAELNLPAVISTGSGHMDSAL
jgi:hypothetical protein